MNPTDSPPTSRPPIPLPPQVEHTRWSFGLVGFYLSCAAVCIGTAIAAAGYLLFDSVGSLVFGCILVPVCGAAMYLSLRAARKPHEPN
jgi:hypothetical protein